MRTVTEIQASIDAIYQGINDIIIGGKSYTISTGNSTRTFTAAEIPDLERLLATYQRELTIAKGCPQVVKLRASW